MQKGKNNPKANINSREYISSVRRYALSWKTFLNVFVRLIPPEIENSAIYNAEDDIYNRRVHIFTRCCWVL